MVSHSIECDVDSWNCDVWHGLMMPVGLKGECADVRVIIHNGCESLIQVNMASVGKQLLKER